MLGHYARLFTFVAYASVLWFSDSSNNNNWTNNYHLNSYKNKNNAILKFKHQLQFEWRTVTKILLNSSV